MAHIYKITNTVNGRVYIGQTKALTTRLRKHKNNLRGSRHSNRPLQGDWNIHGEGAFTFEELLVCSPEDLNLYESRAIKAYDCIHPGGYNLTSGGSRLTKVSESTKRKMSTTMKLRSGLIGEANRQRIWSKESRQKTSSTLLGRVFSKEHKQRIAEANRRRAVSQTSKQRNAESHRGKIPSEEARQRMSQSQIGRVQSPETIAKRAASQIGRPCTPETRAKIAATRKRNKELKETSKSE